MSTAMQRRKVRNFVFKRSNGQCECIRPRDTNGNVTNQCPENIERETCHFVNKDNIPGEMIVTNDVIAICNPCYYKKLYRN